MDMLERFLAGKPTYAVGFLQATAAAVYVAAFVTTAINVGHFVKEPPAILGPVIFLTAFVTSALICGFLVLAYPAYLALKGKIKTGLCIIAWSAAWLILILLSYALLLVVFSDSATR